MHLRDFIIKLFGSNRFYIFLLFGLLSIHIFYLGKGALFFPDESRYLKAIGVYDGLTNPTSYTFKETMDVIFSGNVPFYTNDRPGDVFIHLIPVALQVALTSLADLPLNHPASLIIPQLFNLFFIGLMAYCLYSIVLAIHDNLMEARLAVFLYLISPFSFLYTRHLTSYDISLSLFLFVLMQVFLYSSINKKIAFPKLIIMGLINGFAISIYPGYFILFFANIGLLIWWTMLRINLRRILSVLTFMIFSISILLIYEYLAKMNNNSYLDFFLSKPAGITQGNSEESWNFILTYLNALLPVFGTFFISIFILYLAISSYRAALSFKQLIVKENTLWFMSFMFFCSWVLYSSIAYGGGLVFYGRLVHMYFPILFIVFFTYIKEKSTKLYGIVVLSFFVCSILILIDCFRLAYPRDVLVEYNKISRKANYINSFESGLEVSPLPYNPYLGIRHSNIVQGEHMIFNATYFLPSPIDTAIKYRMEDYHKIESVIHPLNFKPYQFEGLSIEQRAKIDILNPLIEIYKHNSKR